jgi:CspA family cold shock protein
MPTGRVKWYDKNKGYGFIENPEGDVFFHFSDIQMEGFKALAEDQRVSYRMLRSPEGLKAKQIRPLDSRASVKSAARYRTLVLMQIRPGAEEAFEDFIGEVPAWYDSFQQDLGLRRIGTWRCGLQAVHLVESEKPYEQAMQGAQRHAHSEVYRKWHDRLLELLEGQPQTMSPVIGRDGSEMES